MVQPTLTALTLIFILGHEAVPAALSNLQAPAIQEEQILPVATQPEAGQPIAETVAPEVQPEAIEAQTEVSDATPKPVLPIQETETESADTDSTSPQLVSEIPVDVTVSTADTVTRHAEGTPTYTVLLDRARMSLSSARTAKGRFTQANADGSLYGGSFAISRPGKLRFEYDAPVPVLIVSDGSTVAMEDRDLDTIDRVPLGSTPLGLILDNTLQFTNDIIVNDVIETTKGFEITAEDATGEMQGTLTMQFSKAENALIGWRTVDAELNTTLVALQDVETNTRINPREFILRDAEDEEDER